MRKKTRVARAARFLVQSLDVVCQMTKWNLHISNSDNASPQHLVLNY